MGQGQRLRADYSDWRDLPKMLKRMEMAVLFDATDCLGQRDRMIQSPPRAGVPVPHDVEAIAREIIETGKRLFKFPAAVVRPAGTISLNKTIYAAMPLAVDVGGTVEARGTDGGQKAWL